MAVVAYLAMPMIFKHGVAGSYPKFRNGMFFKKKRTFPFSEKHAPSPPPPPPNNRDRSLKENQKKGFRCNHPRRRGKGAESALC